MLTLLLAFAAGLLSILSPCVLPLVPIVLGAAVTGHRLGPVALAAGLALSFTLFGLLVALAGFALGIDATLLHLVAASIMIAIGAVLVFPTWQTQLAAAGAPLSAWADRRLQTLKPSPALSGVAGQFMVGLLLGGVWSPCVGPTLGAASLLAARGRELPQVVMTMVLFGIGAGLPLVLLGLASRTTLSRLRVRLLSAGKIGRAVLGAAFIVVGMVVVTGVDKKIEAALVTASPQWLTDLTTSI